MYTTRWPQERSRRNRTGSKQQWCYDGIVTTDRPTARVCGRVLVDLPLRRDGCLGRDGTAHAAVFDALGTWRVVEPDPASGTSRWRRTTTTTFWRFIYRQPRHGGSARTQRMFYYDMPSRVSMACNPETLGPDQDCNMSSTGTWYYYDPNSNLTSKTDNRSITTSYTYDALNRLLQRDTRTIRAALRLPAISTMAQRHRIFLEASGSVDAEGRMLSSSPCRPRRQSPATMRWAGCRASSAAWVPTAPPATTP